MDKTNKKIMEWLKTKGKVIIKDNNFVLDKTLNNIELMKFLRSINHVTSWLIDYEINNTIISIK